MQGPSYRSLSANHRSAFHSVSQTTEFRQTTVCRTVVDHSHKRLIKRSGWSTWASCTRMLTGST